MKALLHYYNARHLKWLVWFVVTVWWVAIVVESYSRGTMRWGELVAETGELTWYLLLFTIFISLLHKLFPKTWVFNNVLDLRKYTGILCWLIALTHAASEMLSRGILGDMSAMTSTAFSLEHGMLFGSLSFLIMLPLFLTSTEFAVQKMGFIAWKRLHKLTHVAFVLGAVHILVIYFEKTGMPYWKTTGALLFYVVGYGIVFWRGRKKG